MNCNSVQNNFIFYFFNELEQSESEKLTEHLNECKYCNIQYQNIKQSLEIIKDEKEIKLNNDFFEKIQTKIQDNKSEQIFSLNFTFFQKISIAASIVLAISIGILSSNYFIKKENYNPVTSENELLYVNDFQLENVEILLLSE